MTIFWSKKSVPLTVQFYYRKWLRYYKESLSCFIEKLKNKNQSGQQQKQAFTDQGKINVLKNKKANISTKKLAEFLGLIVHVIHELVDHGDGYLFHL
jgi:hypothetical protein